jgi:TP901 family phage tail tape measure protein
MEKMLALGVVLSATDMLSPVFGKAGKNLKQFDGKVKALGSSLTKLGTVSLGLGTALAAPLGAALTSYQDLAAAQGEIASLGISDSGIKAITKASMEFSNQFAGTTAPEFVKASYDIKSGIASLSDEGVAKFTKLAAMTASATKSSTAEMTKLFALGHGIYRSQFNSDVEFGNKFSSAISTAVQAFRTDGTDLVNGLSTLGASATSMGISLSEQLSILGVSKSSFNSASEAATSYRAFLQGVGNAQEKLGLQFTDSAGKMLPMTDVLGQIKDKYGDITSVEAQDELKKAFGSSEAVKMITSLLDKTGELSAAQTQLNENMADGTKVTKDMALAMNKGREFEVLGQKMGNLSALIGQSFAPIALEMGNVIGNVVTVVQTWMNENEGLASTITTVLAGLAGLLTVFGTIAISVGAVTMAIPALTTAFAVLSGGIGFLGTTIGFVGKMFLMNPIGLVVTAIAGAAYLIYSNWGAVKGFFIDMWAGIKTGFSQGWEFIKTIFSYSPLGLVTQSYGKIFDWLSSKFEWFGKSVSKLKSIGSSIKGFFGFGDDEKEKTAANSNGGITQNPSINYASPNISSPATKGVQQNNHIKVIVTNPSSNVDVEKAIVNAMGNKGADRGLSDDM